MSRFALFFIATLSSAFASPIDQALQPFIDSKKARGLVSLVADSDKVLHLSAQGLADVTAGRAMETDSLFWIASMTKPMTAAAVMMLQDEGKLKLSDPVAKYLPSFAGEDITILQCLNHTSGMANVPSQLRSQARTLEDYMKHVPVKPHLAEPGTVWKYCQSSINTAGRIVEVLSGKELPDFFQDRLFTPLDMHNTSFFPNEDACKKLARGYHATQTESDEALVNSFLGHGPIVPWKKDRYPLANGGLYSTAEDCMRFCQMLLNEGELQGQRILSKAAVKEMTSVTTGKLKTGFTPGNGWGVGTIITPRPQGATASLSPGSYGHGGAWGTQMWVDPVKKRIHILMVQRTGVPNGDGSPLRKAFHDAAKDL